MSNGIMGGASSPCPAWADFIVPSRLRTPRWKGPGADSEEKREPASDINTCAVDGLKVLDPERPIREADVHFAFVPIPGSPPCQSTGMLGKHSIV